MQAFIDTPLSKQTILDRVAAHRAADELVKGKTGDDGKGCAIWCSFEYYDHERAEADTNIPQMLSQQWPTRLTNAFKEGSDYSLVGWKFLHWLVGDTLEKYADTKTAEACKPALETLGMAASGTPYTESAARSAAWSAERADRAERNTAK